MEKILDKIKTKKNNIKEEKNKANKERIKKFTSGEVIFLIIATCLISLLFGYMINNKTNSKDEDKTLDELFWEDEENEENEK